MASSKSSLCLLSMFAVDGKVLSDSLPHFAVSSYNSQSQKNECIFADISLPILQAFFKFIFILRIICSLKLFDNSTSPHSHTHHRRPLANSVFQCFLQHLDTVFSEPSIF